MSRCNLLTPTCRASPGPSAGMDMAGWMSVQNGLRMHVIKSATHNQNLHAHIIKQRNTYKNITQTQKHIFTHVVNNYKYIRNPFCTYPRCAAPLDHKAFALAFDDHALGLVQRVSCGRAAGLPGATWNSEFPLVELLACPTL